MLSYRGYFSSLFVASMPDVSAVSRAQASPERLRCHVCGGGCSNLAGSLAKRCALLESQTADSNCKPRRESCGLTKGTWNLGAVSATLLTGAGAHGAPLNCAPECRLPCQLASVGRTAVPRLHYLLTSKASLHATIDAVADDLAAIACAG